MKEINKTTLEFLTDSYIDAIDIAVVDFKNQSIESKLFSDSNVNCDKPVFFDLASVSKPLTNGAGFLAHKDLMTGDMELALNHRAGLPAWGLLSRDNWKETILNYPIKESSTLYSDYSALRFMLEFEKLGMNLHSEASKFWDKEVFFWKDLKENQQTVQNGFINYKPNFTKVHDPNAYNIDNLVSHAGLFGTALGVAKTLLNLNSELDLVNRMNFDLKNSDSRFINGWDRVENPENTFAGSGCSQHTFGHLGFTGTSIWIDSEKKLGHILLSNATKFYWYDKKNFNLFRKEIGKIVWQNFTN